MKKDKTEFQIKLEKLLNCCSLECESDTPDFILAEYLKDCLESYNKALQRREQWYGRSVMWSGDGLPTTSPPTVGI
jgi:hypothetical protein